VLDIEAYNDDLSSIARAYAIGFFSNKDLSCKTFYIDKNLNSVDLIHRCIDEMLNDKYKNINLSIKDIIKKNKPGFSQRRSYSSSSTDKSLIKLSKLTLDDLVLKITKNEKKQINEIIDSVKDTKLFQIAFTHKSCCSNKSELKSYETLEFFGDSLLNYFSAKFLYTVFPDYNEGDLTKIRSLLVGTKNLERLSKEIGLNRYLILNKTLSEKDQKNILKGDKIFADIFESFIAMLYSEKGEDTLLNFLLLTIFNSSFTKGKKEEFVHRMKLIQSKSTILSNQVPLVSNVGQLQSDDYYSLLEESKKVKPGVASTNNKELLRSENSNGMVIPLDIKSMNQITFKFSDLNTPLIDNYRTQVVLIESLLNKNNQIIKELIKLQTTHDRILDLNSIIKSELKSNLLSNEYVFKNLNLNQKFNLNQTENINKSLENINKSLENINKSVENINKSVEKLEIFDQKILKHQTLSNNRQFKLSILRVIIGISIALSIYFLKTYL